MKVTEPRTFVYACVVFVLVAICTYVLTAPAPLPSSVLTRRPPDVNNGEYLLNAGGCINCHGTPGEKDRLSLGGGHSLKSPFGAFVAPNISSHPQAGIGSWSELQFVNAMLRGVGKAGEHLFPSFPYTSYQHMSLEDVRDLYAFLMTVPAESRKSEQHHLVFPFNLRSAVGVWKFLYFEAVPATRQSPGKSEMERGAYLVEGPGHCAECHSGRTWLGGIEPSRRFAGGREPGGTSWVPNITPHADGLPDWSVKDFEFFLETGFTPEGIAAGSTMADVIRSTSKLTTADRRAMAIYLKALPPRPGKKPPRG